MSAPFSTGPLASLATGIAVLDDRLRVIWLNDALAEILEVGIRSVRGKDFSSLLDEPGFAEQASRVLTDGVRLCMREVALHTLRGETLAADLDLQARQDGHLLLEVHVLAEETSRDTPLSATLRGFAHEVKNPLAGLRGAAQLLQRRVESPELVELAGMVIGEADRLATLADRLLRHGGRPQLGAVDLHSVLGRVTAVMESHAHAVQILHDYDPSLPPCTGDADRLQQLLLNLTCNAAEAGAACITLRSRVEHGLRLHERMVRTAIRVEVIDDGPGVPEDLRDSLFDPLVSGRPDGTGLGLALARETAHEHGGELRCSSQPGHTVFSLFLPLRDAHARNESDPQS